MAKIYRDAEGVEIPRGVAFEHKGFAFAANWLDLADEDDLAKHGFIVEETAD